jgi:urate oxidase
VARLVEHGYGKAGVRLATVERDGDRHAFHDLTVRMRLSGDFAVAYTDADNTTSLPTDTMKNTVYALAADASVAETERFLERIARRLLAVTPAASLAEVHADVHGWDRLVVAGAEHPHAFRRASSDATASVAVPRAGDATVRSGLSGLTVAKTTGSGFTDFLVDDLTTLGPTADRILATAIEAEWTWLRPPPSYPAARPVVAGAIETAFATRYSASVQQTIYDAARAVLDAVPEIATVTLALPNRHHIAVDLTPLGRANTNSVFVVLDRPYGLIEGTVRR